MGCKRWWTWGRWIWRDAVAEAHIVARSFCKCCTTVHECTDPKPRVHVISNTTERPDFTSEEPYLTSRKYTEIN